MKTHPEVERKLMEAHALAAVLMLLDYDPAADREVFDPAVLRDYATVIHRLIGEAHELLDRDELAAQ